MNKKYRVVTILRGIVSSAVLDMAEDDSIRYRKHLVILKQEGYLDDFQIEEANNVNDIVVQLILKRLKIE